MKHFSLVISLLLLMLAGCSKPASQQDAIQSSKITRSKKPIVMLDPGHGGEDLGSSSKQFGYSEKSLTLTTVLYLKAELEKMGYDVRLTRSTDKDLTLNQRVALSNALRPKIFVSVHYNASPNTKACGIEVFYSMRVNSKEKVLESKRLATCVLKQAIRATGAESRGVKTAGFRVIQNSQAPSILIEGGFLTNAVERAKIKTTRYQKMLASGIAYGIDDYFKQQESGKLSSVQEKSLQTSPQKTTRPAKKKKGN